MFYSLTLPQLRYFIYAITLLASAGSLGLMAYAGQSFESLLSGFTLWVVAPYAVLAAAGAIARTWPVVIVSLLVSLICIGYAILVYLDAFFVHTHSTSALVFIFVPLYQLIVAAAVLLASCISRWAIHSDSETR